MSTLWLAIANAREDDRARAVDALHDAGLEVGRAWMDNEPTATATTPEPEPDQEGADPVGITFFIGVATIFLTLAIWLFTLGGWWIAGTLACAIITLIAATGAAACSQPKPHD